MSGEIDHGTVEFVGAGDKRAKVPMFNSF